MDFVDNNDGLVAVIEIIVKC